VVPGKPDLLWWTSTATGFIDDDLRKKGKSYRGFQVFGPTESLLENLEKLQVTNLVVSITGEIKGDTFQAILDAQERGVEVTRMPILYEEMTGRCGASPSDAGDRSFVDQPPADFVRISQTVMDFIIDWAGHFAFIFPSPV
jgi:hypothetical protein